MTRDNVARIGEIDGFDPDPERSYTLPARFYHDPAILVLDEATSSLDLDTEAEFMKIIHSLKKKKTILLISHRLSVMESCDRKYRLQAGQLQPLGAQPAKG